MTRRELVRAGSLGLFGLSFADVLRGRASAQAVSARSFGRAKRCILLFMWGGPAHQDTWDLKPEAQSEFRGPYKPIRSKVPGMQLSELHPKLSQVTDQFCLIRSMTHPRPINNHFDAMHNLLSGHVVERVREGEPDSMPYIGSVVAKHLSNERNLITNAWLIKCVGAPVFCAPNLGSGGYLGSSYAPVFIGSADNHPAMPKFKLPEVYEMGSNAARLQERRKLLDALESDRLAGDAGGKDWSELRELAYDAMTRPEGRAAFDLKQEPLAVRERYGMHPLGQNLLLARRMVEAGVRFVTVNGWVGPAPGETGGGPPASSWDMHGGNMGMGNAFSNGSYGMNFCLPRLDESLSALLTDLKERGMLEDTLVIWTGEFGRTPRVGQRSSDAGAGKDGRDHWGGCFTSVLAGAGVKGGFAYGKSDKQAAFPAESPVAPRDLIATVYHLLGVPEEQMVMDSGGRPQFVRPGKAIGELLA